MHGYVFNFHELMMFTNAAKVSNLKYLDRLPDDLPPFERSIPVARNGQFRMNADLTIQNHIWPAAELSGIHARAWGMGINGYA